MAYIVTLKAGLANVVLPNGNLYQGGAEVILTDEQYGRMTDSARTAVLQTTAVVPVPEF
ncbi:hypothetical protein ACFQ6C_26095 [Streptomyces sp. NPDC056454]|uniref:hypothetical protein n=1 Tax=Streptomyces sp. NPDC056454 TaxID=3345823 RepID=UPI0036B7BD90